MLLDLQRQRENTKHGRSELWRQVAHAAASRPRQDSPHTKPLRTRSQVLAAPATQCGPATVSQPSHRQRVLRTELFSTEAAVVAVKKAEVFTEPSCPDSHH